MTASIRNRNFALACNYCNQPLRSCRCLDRDERIRGALKAVVPCANNAVPPLDMNELHRQLSGVLEVE